VGYYAQDHQTLVDPESIFLTTSTSEAYSYIFRLLCNPGEELLVPKPSYPLFEFLADLQDVALVPYSLQYAHGWFIDFQSLEAALTPQSKAILLVHPNNPTGSYVHPEEVTRLNRICQERDLALIVDEVFLDFPFGARDEKSLAINTDVLTLTLSGLSKISALPQMKVAWLAVSGPAAQVQSAVARLEVIADTFLSMSAPTQAALPTLLSQRHSLRTQILARVKENHVNLVSLLRNQSNCEVLHTEAGWYAVLQLRNGLSGEEVALRLLREHHVFVHPGHFYDFATDNFLVISLITPIISFREGLARLSSLL